MSTEEEDFDSRSINEQAVYWYERVKTTDPDPASVRRLCQWLGRSPEHVKCFLRQVEQDEKLRELMKKVKADAVAMKPPERLQ